MHFAPLALCHALSPIAEIQYPASPLIEMIFRSTVIFDSVSFITNCHAVWTDVLLIMVTAVIPGLS